MQPKTIVRISISSPYYGLLDKAIQVEAGGPFDEREYINEAIYGLTGEVNRWMEEQFPREITDPIQQIVYQFEMIQMKNRMKKK